MALLCILGKVVPEKLFSFFIKNFWIKLFKNIQFFNHLLYSVSYFETRTSNASDFEPFFHNSTNFESKFLERFRFWNKRFYNASDFELNLIFLTKNRFWWKFCFQKITFGSFYTKKRHFLQLSVFSETNNCLKQWKKTAILSRLLQRIWFWSKFLTARHIRSKIFKISQFLVNFRQLVIFCIENFTARRILKNPFATHQDLNGNFNNATDFHVKLVSNHQASLDNLLSKNFFCQFTSLKCQSWRFPTFLENLFLTAMFLGKRHSLNRKLWEKSDFESVFLQRFWLLNKISTSCQSLNWISTKRRNLNRDFYHALDFDEKTVLRKWKFVGKLVLKE